MTKGIVPYYFLNVRPSALVALAILLAFISAPSLQAQAPQVVSKFGQAQVAGRDVIVHVTVVVPRGADPNQVALDALRNQGARPFQGDEFSTDRKSVV